MMLIEELEIKKAETIKDLVLNYHQDFVCGFVEELNSIAIAIPFQHSMGHWMGSTAVKSGATLYAIIETDSELGTFYIYTPKESNKVELYHEFGDYTEIIVNIYSFDLAVKKFDIAYLDDIEKKNAHSLINGKVSSSVLQIDGRELFPVNIINPNTEQVNEKSGLNDPIFESI